MEKSDWPRVDIDLCVKQKALASLGRLTVSTGVYSIRPRGLFRVSLIGKIPLSS